MKFVAMDLKWDIFYVLIFWNFMLVELMNSILQGQFWIIFFEIFGETYFQFTNYRIFTQNRFGNPSHSNDQKFNEFKNIYIDGWKLNTWDWKDMLPLLVVQNLNASSFKEIDALTKKTPYWSWILFQLYFFLLYIGIIWTI